MKCWWWGRVWILQVRRGRREIGGPGGFQDKCEGSSFGTRGALTAFVFAHACCPAGEFPELEGRKPGWQWGTAPTSLLQSLCCPCSRLQAGRVSRCQKWTFSAPCVQAGDLGKENVFGRFAYSFSCTEKPPPSASRWLCNLNLKMLKPFLTTLGWLRYFPHPPNSTASMYPSTSFPIPLRNEMFLCNLRKYFNIHVMSSLSGLLHGAKWMVLGTLNILLTSTPSVYVCTSRLATGSLCSLTLPNPFVSISVYITDIALKNQNIQMTCMLNPLGDRW